MKKRDGRKQKGGTAKKGDEWRKEGERGKGEMKNETKQNKITRKSTGVETWNGRRDL